MSTAKGKQRKNPDGSARKSQLVTTYGPGSMVDLLHDAVLIGGLDSWAYDPAYQPPHIDEPRLRTAIVERYAQGHALAHDHPFRAPPTGDDREASPQSGVHVLEFPEWYVCQNPGCRALRHKSHLDDRKSNRRWHRCPNRKLTACVPVRFVEACAYGHLSDFRWVSFAHGKKDRCTNPLLTLEEGVSGDFHDIRVRCECGASARLSGALGGAGFQCRGERPWLGREASEECDQHVRLLVRTASYSYFPQVQSAITIPDPAAKLRHDVQKVWNWVKQTRLERLGFLREEYEEVRTALEGHTDEAVMDVIEALRTEKPVVAGPLRTAEFKQLSGAALEQPGDLASIDDTFFARRAQLHGATPSGVARVVIAPKLREVVALIGFTRIDVVTADVQGEYDVGVKMAPLSLRQDWLPATEILGEGVFLELDEARVHEWEHRPEVQARKRQLEAGYKAWAAKQSKYTPPFLDIRFYMLHSLSHLLMSAISLECGYAASAMRERIYAGPSSADPTTPMAAILLSTGTTGSEGTLGGLVEQGRKIAAHLQRAWDSGRLCSNDPVCGSHSPENDHAERYLEGAACHGCLFIAECSCERFNRYLDRALVVPTLGHSERVAFFDTRP